MTISIIQYKTPEYTLLCNLRNEVLRIPIGLKLTLADIRKEENDIFIAAFKDTTVIGCCVLTEVTSTEVRLRQMAVHSNFQQKGIGTDILNFAEQVALRKGYNMMSLHARKSAVAFYEKEGYITTSQEYLKIGIPHFSMQKQLQS